MANISSSYGTITLRGDWTKEMVEQLNTVKEEWRNWYYNTYTDDTFSKDKMTIQFDGTGRWVYQTHRHCQRNSYPR